MRCFYHGDVEGVAICKSCGRAICHDCCADVATSAACRNRCEPDVEGLNDLVNRNKAVYNRTGGVYIRSGLFILVLGLAFTGIGVAFHRNGGPDYFFFIMGPLFMLYGVSQFFNARVWRKK